MFRIKASPVLGIVLAVLAATLTTDFSGPGGGENASRAQERRAKSTEDYLSPELRAKVQQLKKDVKAGPSTKKNGPERAMILWDWANAYALADGVLPVDLPSLVGRVGGQKNTSPGGLRQLDRYIRQLALRDQRPTAIGTLTSDADDPFLPGSYVTIQQTYHFGDMEMVPGGGFFVAKHFMSNQGAYQTNDPKADNYITVKSNNPEAKFVVDTRPMGGMHGGFRGATPGLFFRLEEGVLTRRDSVTITSATRVTRHRSLAAWLNPADWPLCSHPRRHATQYLAR